MDRVTTTAADHLQRAKDLQRLARNYELLSLERDAIGNLIVEALESIVALTSQRTVAENLKVSAQYLCDLLNKRRAMNSKLNARILDTYKNGAGR